jgi:hypothetical protein
MSHSTKRATSCESMARERSYQNAPEARQSMECGFGITPVLGSPVITQAVDHESRLQRSVSGINEADTESRYLKEAFGRRVESNYGPGSSAFAVPKDDRVIVAWEVGDNENPYNWSAVSGLC